MLTSHSEKLPSKVPPKQKCVPEKVFRKGGPAELTCKKCQKKFYGQLSLVRHLHADHRDELQDEVQSMTYSTVQGATRRPISKTLPISPKTTVSIDPQILPEKSKQQVGDTNELSKNQPSTSNPSAKTEPTKLGPYKKILNRILETKKPIDHVPYTVTENGGQASIIASAKLTNVQKCSICNTLVLLSYVNEHKKQCMKKHQSKTKVAENTNQTVIDLTVSSTSTMIPDPCSTVTPNPGIVDLTIDADLKTDEKQGISCHICTNDGLQIFKTFADLKDHVNAKHKSISDDCHKCGIIFSSYTTPISFYKLHLQNHKRITVLNKTTPVNSTKKRIRYELAPNSLAVCQLCSAHRPSMPSLLEHYCRFHNKVEYQCPYCNHKFPQQAVKENRINDFFLHIHEEHLINPITNNAIDGFFSCKHCDMTFGTRASCTVHEMIHEKSGGLGSEAFVLSSGADLKVDKPWYQGRVQRFNSPDSNMPSDASYTISSGDDLNSKDTIASCRPRREHISSSIGVNNDESDHNSDPDRSRKIPNDNETNERLILPIDVSDNTDDDDSSIKFLPHSFPSKSPSKPHSSKEVDHTAGEPCNKDISDDLPLSKISPPCTRPSSKRREQQSQKSDSPKSSKLDDISMNTGNDDKQHDIIDQEKPNKGPKDSDNSELTSLVCQLCPKLFSSADAVRDHYVRGHDALEFYQCKWCDDTTGKMRKPMERVYTFFAHIRRKHTIEPLTNQKLTCSDFKCINCQHNYCSSYELDEHLHMYENRVCRNAYRNRKGLTTEQPGSLLNTGNGQIDANDSTPFTEGKSNSKSDDSNGTHLCFVCGKKFNGKKN